MVFVFGDCEIHASGASFAATAWTCMSSLKCSTSSFTSCGIETAW